MIGIIDYNSGNIASVKNALDKLGFANAVLSSPSELAKCSRVIFPGVGRAGEAMKELKRENLVETIRKLEVPFLGICLGLQLLAEYSEEDDTPCMGVMPGQIVKFPSSLKIPQIGWNKVSFEVDSPLFKGIASNEYFYFVNSYYYKEEGDVALATSKYGLQFVSVLKSKNFYATQFHPEKSGEQGLKLLSNFCELC